MALTEDQGRSCLEARTIAAEHLGAVREKTAELRKLKASLAGFIRACDGLCAGGPGPDCVILQGMAEPSPEPVPGLRGRAQ